MATSCNGLLAAIGLNPGCSTSIDSLSGYSLPLYDATSPTFSSVVSSSSSSFSPAFPVCNDMAATAGKQLVASPNEPYVGSYCIGIIDSFYVGASSTVNASLAPLLPPFVLQNITESKIIGFESLVPQFFTSSCLTSRIELMCSLMFMKPHPNNALKAYFGTIYFPSFPAKSLCTRYSEHCAFLISTSYSATYMNCSGKVKGSTMDLYPSHPQLVSTIMGIPFRTPPNTLLNASIVPVIPQCPYGFALTPEGPTHVNSISIDGTACSLACPIAYATPEEYDWEFDQTKIGCLITLAFTALQVINLAVLKPQKQNIFLVCFILSTFLFNIIQALQIFMVSKREELVCESETAAYSMKEPVRTTGYNLCATNALLNLYLHFFYMWILFALSSEIWCRVYWGCKKVTIQRRYYMLGSAVLLLLNALLASFLGEPDINKIGNTGTFCSWVADDNENQFLIFILPDIITFGLSFIMICHSIYVCIKTSLSVQDTDRKPLQKIWKSYSMLILFLILEMLVNPPRIFGGYLYMGYLQVDNYIDSINEWSQCIFSKYVTNSNSHYLDICGMTPSERPSPMDTMIILLFVTYANAVLLFIITLNKEVKAFWWTLFIKVISSLGIRDTLAYLHVIQKSQFAEAKESNIFNAGFRRMRRNSFSKMTVAPSKGMTSMIASPVSSLLFRSQQRSAGVSSDSLGSDSSASDKNDGTSASRPRDSLLYNMMNYLGFKSQGQARTRGILSTNKVAVLSSKQEEQRQEKQELDCPLAGEIKLKPSEEEEEHEETPSNSQRSSPSVSPRRDSDLESQQQLQLQPSIAGVYPLSSHNNAANQPGDIALFTVASAEAECELPPLHPNSKGGNPNNNGYMNV
jgi:hypothetical protein